MEKEGVLILKNHWYCSIAHIKQILFYPFIGDPLYVAILKDLETLFDNAVTKYFARKSRSAKKNIKYPLLQNLQ